MRLLLDLGHPAHVHLFRNLVLRVQKEGGEVLAATRDKDVTVGLCDAFGIPQTVLSKAYSGSFISGISELLERTIKLLAMTIKFKPDALLGTSMSIGVVGKLTRLPSFIFSEDDADIIPLMSRFVYPTCTYIVTPECLRHENYGRKHLTYPGYHELAYLHPDHFTPDPEVPESIGLDINTPYFILRFVSLKAHHDTHASGLPAAVAEQLVRMLGKHGKILITSEGELKEKFNKYQYSLSPEKFHDVLAFASLYIGDSQTVAMESSILGVPNIRCNSFVGRITCLEELENVYQLTKGFLPDQNEALISYVQQLLKNLKFLKIDFKKRRQAMLEKSVNLTEWLWQTLNRKLS